MNKHLKAANTHQKNYTVIPMTMTTKDYLKLIDSKLVEFHYSWSKEKEKALPAADLKILVEDLAHQLVYFEKIRERMEKSISSRIGNELKEMRLSLEKQVVGTLNLKLSQLTQSIEEKAQLSLKRLGSYETLLTKIRRWKLIGVGLIATTVLNSIVLYSFGTLSKSGEENLKSIAKGFYLSSMI